jgi:hypothetical protein
MCYPAINSGSGVDSESLEDIKQILYENIENGSYVVSTFGENISCIGLGRNCTTVIGYHCQWAIREKVYPHKNVVGPDN